MVTQNMLARRQMGLFGVKILFVTALDLIKCFEQIE